MSFDRTRDMARAALARSEGLGFDRLSVGALQSRLFGVRIANGAVCRENVDRLSASFDVRGSYARREGGFDVAATSPADLDGRVRALRDTLEGQPPDAEHVPSAIPAGSYAYDLAATPFDEAYAPEHLYGMIAELSRRARARGLRLTGYVEAQETTAHRFVRTGGASMELATRDHGLSVSLTVDDPASGAVSAGNRGVARATPQLVSQALEGAYAEAERQCLAARKPEAPEPGDYTVVLHPQAVVDIVNTALMYGLFDRRKIDEGRTYLAGRLAELPFPRGLGISQTTSLALGPGEPRYLDMPFNHRLVPCADLHLIRDGHVEGLHTSPFWARQRGLHETFDANAAAPATSIEASESPGLALEDDIAALIRSTERGFYVANTWYLRMVAEMDGVITGMTRDGVFAIENGHLTGPVLNMRWHDNPFRVLGAVTGATRERLLFGRSRLAGQGRTRLSAAPALRVDGFHMSSVTRF
jgi:predicted Zn-dependent protease